MEYTARMVKNGNIKIGQSMWSWNKLAGAGEIAGCKGTCGEHCQGCYNTEDPKHSSCYVFKSYNQYGWDQSSVVKGHIRNTNIMRANPDQAFEEIRLQLQRAKKKPSAVRVHAAGELETAKELRGWIETAEMFSDVPFYIYTKAYEVLEEVLSTTDVMPDNFFINISIWHDDGVDVYNKWKHLDTIRAFVYDDNWSYGDKLKYDCHCPAYDAAGKLSHDLTCDKCKICFQKKAKVCACYSH
jgi:hypothetical protein